MINSDLVRRSDKLDKALEGADLNQAVKDLVTYGRRNRSLIRWVIVSVVLEVILTLSVGIVFFNQLRSQGNILKNSQSIVDSCKSNNEFRQSNRVLWQYILDIPPTAPVTPERQKIAADFKTFLDKTFAPRDCDALQRSVQ